MCRVYHPKNKPPYIWLCARRRPQKQVMVHIPYTGQVPDYGNGCVTTCYSGPDSRAARPRERALRQGRTRHAPNPVEMLWFEGVPELHPEAVADMARYAGAIGQEYYPTANVVGFYFSRKGSRMDASAVIARAASFGWRLLPGPPLL